MTLLQEVQKQSIKIAVPKLKVGQTVKVHQKIKEGNKERTQIFEGLILKLNSGHGADKTVTVRKVVDGIGVEKVFPIYSPLFTFEVIKVAKVRRAKLYYMRERSGKSARLKERFVNKVEMEDAPMQETAEAEAPVETMESTTEETSVEEAAQEEAVAEEEKKEEKSE